MAHSTRGGKGLSTDISISCWADMGSQLTDKGIPGGRTADSRRSRLAVETRAAHPNGTQHAPCYAPPNPRGISLIDGPSARCRRRISAQFSTLSTSCLPGRRRGQSLSVHTFSGGPARTRSEVHRRQGVSFNRRRQARCMSRSILGASDPFEWRSACWVEGRIEESSCRQEGGAEGVGSDPHGRTRPTTP
jgi:hypothetical protein